MEKLNSLFVKYSQTLGHVESALRTLTYLVPGRFDEGSEALYAFLNLTGMYHDYIVAMKLMSQGHDMISAKQVPPLNKYTRSFLVSSSRYKRLAYLLTIIQFSEVFAEMAVLKRFGVRAKWRLVISIELIKLILRLALLRETGNRMLLASVVPERSDYMLSLSQQQMEQDQLQRRKSVTPVEPKQNVKKLRLGLPVMEEVTPGDVTRYLDSKAMLPSSRNPLRLLNPLVGERLLGELIHICRPIIYAYLMYRESEASRDTSSTSYSWKPWLVSLALDLISRANSKYLFTKQLCRVANIPVPLITSDTLLESEERHRRMWMLIYYLLRSPFYNVFTKEPLQDFCSATGRVPILSLFTGIIQEYIPLWEKIFFYTSQ